ncbi:MAG: hypothetical protein IPK75_18250 [Acidobacteria bacterium]|nr:hypothetical protein [Acidobacteriota bacterium]
MAATAAALVTTRPGRVRYGHYETLSGAAGSCPMCGAPIEAHVPHACAKPDLDHRPHAVRTRSEPFESATLPFLVHRGMTCRFEGRVYRYTNYAPLCEGRVRDSDLVESREHFYELVGMGVLEEINAQEVQA